MSVTVIVLDSMTAPVLAPDDTFAVNDSVPSKVLSGANITVNDPVVPDTTNETLLADDDHPEEKSLDVIPVLGSIQ